MSAIFISREIEKKLTAGGYSTAQIEQGREVAVAAYSSGIEHSGGKLFDACLQRAKAVVGKPKGNK